MNFQAFLNKCSERLIHVCLPSETWNGGADEPGDRVAAAAPTKTHKPICLHERGSLSSHVQRTKNFFDYAANWINTRF